MSRSPNQKQKLLALLEILRAESDENHPLSTADLIAALARQGISAERKSIYDDIATLTDRGYDIVTVRGKGCYLASREFELAELKLLVDAVQSSKFISEGKSRTLIRKLESLCSRHEAGQLQRQVFVSGRVKTMNESVLYSIDALHEAIATDRQVQFRYFDYNAKKEKVFRHGNKTYTVSPVGLLRSDECYYLVAVEGSDRRHYRVDRMTGITLTNLPRIPGCAELDMAAYTRRHFSMFSGVEQQVKLRCPNALAHVFLDQFGMDVMLIPQDGAHFTLTVEVAVSPLFYGWLFALGAEVEILAPADVRAEYAALLTQGAARHQQPSLT